MVEERQTPSVDSLDGPVTLMNNLWKACHHELKSIKAQFDKSFISFRPVDVAPIATPSMSWWKDGFPQVYRVTAETKATTMTDLVETGLFWNVKASETWAFEFFVGYESAEGASIKFSVVTPEGTTGVWSPNHQTVNDNPTENTLPAVGAGLGTKKSICIKGFAQVNAPGKIRLLFAQNHLSETPAILLPSYLLACKVVG